MKSILAAIVSIGLSSGAHAMTIVDVEAVYPNTGSVFVQGYGNPWTSPALFTTSTGKTMLAFCDDLQHIVYVGGGQFLNYEFAPVTVDGYGNSLTRAQSSKMGMIANIGAEYYYTGNVNGAIAAQAAIWATEYNVAVSSSIPSVENYIIQFENMDSPNTDYALGIISNQGFQGQLITTIPETKSWLMFGIGMTMLALAGRRRMAL